MISRSPRFHKTAFLTKLTKVEQSLSDDLRHNHRGDGILLEKEKIGYTTLIDTLGKV
jgi:hypothetical protein